MFIAKVNKSTASQKVNNCIKAFITTFFYLITKLKLNFYPI